MITGFNTDVKYRGVVYHVQTEDKGEGNPLIETLIYKGGEILGSRRLPYARAHQEPDDEAAITKLMEDQHKAMILEVKQRHVRRPAARRRSWRTSRSTRSSSPTWPAAPPSPSSVLSSDRDDPALEALRRRLEEEETAYAEVLAAVDRLASFSLPAEALPELPARLGRLNASGRRRRVRREAAWAEPSGSAPGTRSRPPSARQTEFNALVVQILNGHLAETARLHAHLRELVVRARALPAARPAR